MTQNHLKKALRRYEEGEAPAQSVSIDEEHHRQIPILMPLRHRKYALKSVPWRRFWSLTLAISSFFSSDLDKFKLESPNKNFEKYFW